MGGNVRCIAVNAPLLRVQIFAVVLEVLHYFVGCKGASQLPIPGNMVENGSGCQPLFGKSELATGDQVNSKEPNTPSYAFVVSTPDSSTPLIN